MTDLSHDERNLLAVLGTATEPMGVIDAVCMTLPPRPDRTQRGDYQKWAARFFDMMLVWTGLSRAGLLDLVLPDHCEITDAGRKALAAVRKQA